MAMHGNDSKGEMPYSHPMFFRRDKDRPSQARPTPGWFKIIVIAFLAYALIHHAVTRRETAEQEGATPPTVTQALSDVATFPTALQGIQQREGERGTGEESYCGQEAEFRYSLFLQDRAIVENETKRTMIGSAALLPGINEVLVGMKKDGSRNFYLGPKLAFDAPGHARADVPENRIVRGEVTLLSLKPSLPDAAMPLRVTTPKEGDGPGIACGQRGVFRVDVWNQKGERVNAHERAPITWRMGVTGAPLGIERGLIGIKIGEVRTLILPPAYLAPVSRYEEEAEVTSVSTQDKASSENISAKPVSATPAAKPASPPAIAWPKQGLVVVDVQRME